MSGEWKSVPIGTVAEIFDGPHATPKTVDAGPIFLGIDSLDNGRLNLAATKHVTELDFQVWTRRVQPAGGDLVFSYETRIGEAALIPDGLRCCLGRRLALIRPNPRVLSGRYLLYYYLSPNFQEFLRSRTMPGSTVDRIHLRDLPSFPIMLPPLAEQRRLADLLGALDDKIELNRRMAETLEAMARSLFRSWFVDFDPIHVKLERRSTELPDDLSTLFPDGFGEDGLPEGWRAGVLAELASLNPENWTRGTLPELLSYVDLANTKWGLIEATQSFTKRDAPSRAQRILRPGDTIVGTVRPANGSYAYILENDLTGSTGFAVLRPKSPKFAALIYLAATARDNIDTLAHLADGAAYPAVRPGVVIDTPLNIPSGELLAAFDTLASPMLASIQQKVEQSRTLAALRDILLPRLISGELRITEAERAIAAA